MSGKGSSAAGGKGPNQGGPGEFSIDNEKSIQLEVPSITRLLDRKKLDLATPVQKASIRPKGAMDRRSESRLVALSDSPSAPIRPLSSEDMARKLKKAISAAWVVVLAAEGATFKAHAVLGGDRTLWALFTGFALGTEHSPSLFAALGQARFLELTAISAAEDAQALRSALALDKSHGLLILASGNGGAMPFLLLTAFPNPSGAAIAPKLAAVIKELAGAKL